MESLTEPFVGVLTRLYSAAPERERRLFVQNQIVYFLGRCGAVEAAKNQLRLIWTSSDTDVLVANAAAFGLMKHLHRQTESEFYARLRTQPASEVVNRAYHLFYYGDIEYSEEAMPPVDGGAAGVSTVAMLCQRCALAEPTALLLRRVEMLTLRRILETRAEPARLTTRQAALLREGLKRALEFHRDDSDYCQALESEWQALLPFV